MFFKFIFIILFFVESKRIQGLNELYWTPPPPPPYNFIAIIGEKTKANDYKHILDAPRRRCFNCGNQNHLDINCKVKIEKKSESKPNQPIKPHYMTQNPYYQYGKKNIITWICVVNIIVFIITFMN